MKNVEAAALLLMVAGGVVGGVTGLKRLPASERAPQQFWAHSPYERLRSHLAGIREARFHTDRDVHSSALYYYTAQYSLAPIVVKPTTTETIEALARGIPLIAHYASRRLLETELATLRKIAASMGHMEELWFSDRLVLIRFLPS